MYLGDATHWSCSKCHRHHPIEWEKCPQCNGWGDLADALAASQAQAADLRRQLAEAESKAATFERGFNTALTAGAERLEEIHRLKESQPVSKFKRWLRRSRDRAKQQTPR